MWLGPRDSTFPYKRNYVIAPKLRNGRESLKRLCLKDTGIVTWNAISIRQVLGGS
jgi:hypothetical protein